MEQTEITEERISEVEEVLRRFFVARQETIRSAAIAVIAVVETATYGNKGKMVFTTMGEGGQ